jgi:hypothetical protein
LVHKTLRAFLRYAEAEHIDSGLRPTRLTNYRFALIWTGLQLVFSISALGSGERVQIAQGTNNHFALTAQPTSFGPIVPGRVGAPAAVVVHFSLPISQAIVALGYHVTAISNFIFTPSVRAAGGKSVTAADFLVGITNVSSTLGAGRSVAIAAGFDYDPATVKGASGPGTLSGVYTQRATMADLLPGREILRAARSTAGVPTAGESLTFSLGIAVPTEFFTPGSFSGTVNLIVSQ